MNQENNQFNSIPLVNQPPDTHSSAEWFASIQDKPPGPSPQKPNRNKKWLIISSFGLFLLVGGSLLTMSFYTTPTCLSRSDYKELTGIDWDNATELDASDEFFSTYVAFKDDTTNYDNSTTDGDHGDALIKKIVNFYETRSNKSVIITIEGRYTMPDKKDVASLQAQAVKESLLRSGIPEDTIEAGDVWHVGFEDSDDALVSIGLSVTSAESCR